MKEHDTQSLLQALEGRTRRLERRVRFTTCGWLLAIGVVLLSAWTWQSKSETVDTLRARQIVIVDEKGRERILLGAPVPKVAGRKRQDDATGMLVLDEDGVDRVAVGYTPDPQNQGKVVKRISSQAGVTFNDKNGTDRGGFGVFDDGSVHLGLDYPTGREVVSLFAGDGGIYSGLLVGSDNKEGAERAGIVVNNKSGRVVLKLADTKSDERLMIDVVGDSAARFILRDPAKNTTVELIEKLKP